ncbi:tetratricopeptide repeat protein [Streptomyces sp. NPDC093109]|uniref:tetratricopeptide repeat protein n=1 Tax=Streptomyces sp. NPDC093109 TaxID=3154977 RepID=UPI00344CB4B0
MGAELAMAVMTAVLQQVATDGWTRARDGMVGIVRRWRSGAPDSPDSLESELESARTALAEARRRNDDATADRLIADWSDRLLRDLGTDPGAEPELRALLDEVAPGAVTFNGEVSAGSAIQAAEIGTLNQHLHFHGRGAGPGAGPGADPDGEQPVPPSMTHPQLPMEEPPFENRDTQRTRVLRAIDERGEAPLVSPLTVVLTGVAGIGKTALAVRLAWELAPRFPAGTIYVDLDQWRTEGTIDVEAVLRHQLRRLGVAEDWLPAEYPALVERYEEKTRGARMALVLDNVWSDNEIATLLPASADALVLITGQRRLPLLETRGAIGLALGPLSSAHSAAMLRKIVTDVTGVTDGQPHESAETVAALARLCDGFPAALRAAGTLLHLHRHRSVERLVADLTSQLHERGLPVVEAVWNASYGELPAPAARLYRLLPGHPGYDITVEAAAALLGTGRYDAEDAVEALAGAGLLAVSPTASERRGRTRFRLHGLLRSHAARCADRHGDRAETEEALRRLLVWYRRQAERADRAIQADRMRLADPVPELPYAPDQAFADEAGARGWLDTERKALYGWVRIAADLGEDTHAWALCEPLWKHYEDHGNHDDAIRAYTAGRDAAERAERPDALIRLRCQLAQALWRAGRAPEADSETEQAVRAAAAAVPGTRLQASALEFRGKFLAWRGEPDRAVTYFRQSRDIHGALLPVPNTYGVLLQGFLLGRALRSAGRLSEAEAELDRALLLAREGRHDRLTARCLAELGRIHRALGRTDRAVAALTEAAGVERHRDATYDEARLHGELAELAEANGDALAAERHRTRVRELREGAGAAPEGH